MERDHCARDGEPYSSFRIPHRREAELRIVRAAQQAAYDQTSLAPPAPRRASPDSMHSETAEHHLFAVDVLAGIDRMIDDARSLSTDASIEVPTLTFGLLRQSNRPSASRNTIGLSQTLPAWSRRRSA